MNRFREEWDHMWMNWKLWQAFAAAEFLPWREEDAWLERIGRKRNK